MLMNGIAGGREPLLKEAYRRPLFMTYGEVLTDEASGKVPDECKPALRWKYAAKAALSQSSSNFKLDTFVSAEIARKALTTATKKNAFVNIEFAHNTPSDNTPIPSWSTQDRLPRLKTTTSWQVELLQSNMLIGLIYVLFFVLPEVSREPENREYISAITIICFIALHLIPTIANSMPFPGVSTDFLNKKTNASTFVAMTLYPCVGVWVLSRPHAWTLSNLSSFYELYDSYGHFAWGFVFPFLMWGCSGLVLIRDSSHACTNDIAEVVSDDNGLPVTALFRRIPSVIEVYCVQVTRALTTSLWHILPESQKPAGGSGRFLFQVFSPVVLLFQYIGFRFVCFSAEHMYFTSHRENFVKDAVRYANPRILNAAFYIWIAFTLFCIIVRCVVPSLGFLRYFVPDKHTYANRQADWMHTHVHSKRTRVQWAFRGLANAFVPYYIYHYDPNPASFVHGVLSYLYFAVYMSYFFEGVGAFFFGLLDAERGCYLELPLSSMMNAAFLAAYNASLQPIATAVNGVASVINGEYKHHLLLREIWGPLLNDRGHFKDVFKHIRPLLTQWKRKKVADVNRDECDMRLEEWVQTWQRKRKYCGMSTDTLTILKMSDVDFDAVKLREPSRVFFGTVFPSRYEWLYMRDHCRNYISLTYGEDVNVIPSKFVRSFPACREEIMTFLREPYDFETRREVWMFGYGSLMSPDCPPAGLTATQKKLLIPYWLRKEANYNRVFNYRHGPCGINAYGLTKVADGCGDDICGCVYPMNYEAASDLFSKREEGYELLLVDERYFSAMHPDYKMPAGVGYVWMCGEPVRKPNCSGDKTCTDILCKRHSPTEDSPILQSYIDAILSGALRYSTVSEGHDDGMNFAAAILKSSRGWNHPWLNDRILPGRPWLYAPYYDIIDGMLSTAPHSREAFAMRMRVSGSTQNTPRQDMYNMEGKRLISWAKMFFGETEYDKSAIV